MATVHKWEKYTVASQFVDNYDENILSCDNNNQPTVELYSGTTPDSKTSTVLLGEITYGNYFIFNGTTYKATSTGSASGRKYNILVVSVTVAESKCSLIETVESENSAAYPTDGAQDGYWYVYTGSEEIEVCAVYATIDGVQKKLTSIPAMIDGVQRELTSLFATVDGVAREIFSAIAESILPDGYTLLDYIESSGTQYIDTGFKPTYRTRVVIDLQMAAYSATRMPFGCRNANSATASATFLVAQTGTNKLRMDYFGSSNTLTIDTTTDSRLEIDLNQNTLTVDGETLTLPEKTSGTSPHNLLLFTYSNSGNAGSLTSMRLYSCQIYDNGTLVRDYVPCVNPNGEAGLYDLVNCEFYSSASGVFVEGPTVGGSTDAGSPISFTIDGVMYSAVSNMTWGDWVKSDYNTAGYYVYGNNYIADTSYPDDPYVVEDTDTGALVTSTMVIVSGGEYTLTM